MLSRVRKLEDLIVERLQSLRSKNTFKYRVIEEELLNELSRITMNVLE